MKLHGIIYIHVYIMSIVFLNSQIKRIYGCLLFCVSRPFLFYNSLHHTRKQVVRIYVNYPHVEVRDANGKPVLTQVDPFWESYQSISTTIFKVHFVASVGHHLGLG